MILFVLFLHLLCIFAGAIDAGRPLSPSVPGSPCIRLFHSTGDVGCRSETNGVNEPLFLIEKAADIGSLVQKAESSVVVLSSSLFTTETLDSIRPYTAGLIVYPENDVVFSPASTSPQGQGSIDASLNPFAETTWNPSGLNLLERSFTYPVFVVQSLADAASIIDQARRNINNGGQTFGATYHGDMLYYFGAASTTSIRCLNFRNIYNNPSPKCDPIGGQSAWAQLGPNIGDSSTSEVVVAMAAMDSNGFANDLSPGANAGFSNVIALLAAADALGSVPVSDFSRTIVFAAFQGESFGFVGSRRFLHDITQFTASSTACSQRVTGAKTPLGSSFCTNPMTTSLEFEKLNKTRIRYALAVDQIGVTSSNLAIHVNPNAADGPTVSRVFVEAASAGNRVVAGSTQSIPPGPLSSFLNANEYGIANLDAGVLTGYTSEFPPGYHSRFDLNSTLNSTQITFAAQILAEALYELGTDNNGTATIAVNSTLVSLMVECFSSNWRCKLMDEVSNTFVQSSIKDMNLVSTSWPSVPDPISFYAGVYGTVRQPTVKSGNSVFSRFSTTWDNSKHTLQLFPNAYETFIRSFLAASVAKSVASSSTPTCSLTSDCDSSSVDTECVYPGICVPRRSYFHNAFSPGLTANDSQRLWQIDNATLPLWTEPRWDSIRTFSFADPGNTIGWISIVIGVVVSGLGVLLGISFLNSFRKLKLM